MAYSEGVRFAWARSWSVASHSADSSFFRLGCIVYNTMCTSEQLLHWQRQESLWKHAITVDPTNVMALHLQGTLVAEQGDYEQAVSLHTEAFALPEYRAERGIKWLSLSQEAFIQISQLMKQQGKQTAGECTVAL